jgi:hypothetical protein
MDRQGITHREKPTVRCVIHTAFGTNNTPTSPARPTCTQGAEGMTCVVPAERSKTTAVDTEPAALGASAGWHPCQVSLKPSEEAATANLL